MKNTYTYTARSAENAEQAVTFTLHDHQMSVGLATPLEQVEQFLEARLGEEPEEGEADSTLWLKPAAVSLLQRGTRPFRVDDVYATAEEDWLEVSAWYRAGGLALAPVTLIEGRVDNREASQAFVEELDRRKTEIGGIGGPFKLLDFWFTWFAIGLFLVGVLQFWRRKEQA